MSIVALLGLMVTHAIVTVAAAAFGYLVVVALREALAAILGPRWFTRVSPWAQGVLIVIARERRSCCCCPRPTASRSAASRGGARCRRPMWFLGAYEMAAGGVDRRPAARADDAAAGRTTTEIASTLYRERRGQFPAMARRAGLAVGLTFLVAAAAYLWNARRLPSLAPAPPPAFRRRWRLGGRLANALLVRHCRRRARASTSRWRRCGAATRIG